MTETHNITILSLDIGTSSLRSQLYDAHAYPVKDAGMQIPYSMDRTPDGGSWIEADLLVDRVMQTIDHATRQAEQRGVRIRAVSCCTFWHNVMGVDGDGSPCTPLLSWDDTRPETVLEDLRTRMDPDSFTQRTGCPFHASYLPAKITWFRRAMPEEAGRVRAWMSAGEYLLYRLTGERRCSYSMASASGLLNSASCYWDDAIRDALSLPLDSLSFLCDAKDGVVNLKPEYAQRWPGLRDARWFPALGDGACSNIGCGCVSPEQIAAMVGTSGAMRMVWNGEYRQPPQGLWCYRIDRNRPVQGGALSNGGNLFAWLRETIDFSRYVDGFPETESEIELEPFLRGLPPDGHGLTFLPFLAGQRSPRWNPNSRGVIHGLRLSTQPVQILQAGLESIAYRFRMIHDLLQDHLSREHRIIATGGGLLHSPSWIQILADVLGQPVVVSRVTEASSRGAAILALESLGVLCDIRDADACLGDPVYPRDEARSIYESGFQRHLDLENRLASF